MPPTVSASRPKQALVRFLNASRQPIGTGCLTIDGLIVTCAHVVKAALGLPEEQAIGAVPRGILTFDFPFLDSKEPQPVPEAGSKQLYRAEVAPGGWGWMDSTLHDNKDEWHKNDTAILKLIGEPPFAYGRMFAETYAGKHDLQLWLRGFPNNDPHAGPVNATLKAQSELHKGLLTLDFEQSLYILNPGCSGAPVFLPDGNAAIGIFIGRPSHLKESHRDEKRIAYAIPASRINALLNAVKQAQLADDTPEEIAKIRSIIPSLQNHQHTVSCKANDPRIFSGIDCGKELDDNGNSPSERRRWHVHLLVLFFFFMIATPTLWLVVRYFRMPVPTLPVACDQAPEKPTRGKPYGWLKKHAPLQIVPSPRSRLAEQAARMAEDILQQNKFTIATADNCPSWRLEIGGVWKDADLEITITFPPLESSEESRAFIVKDKYVPTITRQEFLKKTVEKSITKLILFLSAYWTS